MAHVRSEFIFSFVRRSARTCGRGTIEYDADQVRVVFGHGFVPYVVIGNTGASPLSVDEQPRSVD